MLSFSSFSYSTTSVVKEIERLNEAELRSGTGKSWHDVYKDSAYIFIGLSPPLFSPTSAFPSLLFLRVTLTAATHADTARPFPPLCLLLRLVSSFVVLTTLSKPPSSFRLLSQGNLDHRLTEGDIRTVFSQFGEPTDLNLVRDKVSAAHTVSHDGQRLPFSSPSYLRCFLPKETGKSKGFCFLAYEDQRSTVLAVDNFNGAKVG